jgi:hypothetical protein
MLRSATAPKATCVAERDVLRENQAGVLDNYLVQVVPEPVRHGSPREITLADDPPTLI